MAADLFEGIFNQILLKTTENDHFETIFPTLALSLPHILKTIGSFLIFYRLLIYRTWIRKIWLVLVHSKQSYAYPPPPPPLVQEGLTSGSGIATSYAHTFTKVHIHDKINNAITLQTLRVAGHIMENRADSLPQAFR